MSSSEKALQKQASRPRPRPTLRPMPRAARAPLLEDDAMDAWPDSDTSLEDVESVGAGQWLPAMEGAQDLLSRPSTEDDDAASTGSGDDAEDKDEANTPNETVASDPELDSMRMSQAFPAAGVPGAASSGCCGSAKKWAMLKAGLTTPFKIVSDCA